MSVGVRRFLVILLPLAAANAVSLGLLSDAPTAWRLLTGVAIIVIGMLGLNLLLGRPMRLS